MTVNIQEKQNSNNCSNQKINPRDANPIFQMLNRQKSESIRRKQQRQMYYEKEEQMARSDMSERERLALFRVHRRRRPTQFQAAIRFDSTI